MSPLSRPPSVAWEPLPLPHVPGGCVWVWFFPAHAPGTIQLQIPLEAAGWPGPPLTVQWLTAALGLSADFLAAWEVNGTRFDLAQGAAPWLAQPLAFTPGAACSITLHLRTAPVLTPAYAAPPYAAAPSAIAPPSGDVASALDSLQSDWIAIQLVERQLDSARKQLAALQGRLQSLNRDLSPEERLHSDNLDRKDWTDARRWLRDAAAQVSRYIREYDIGAVSGAGGRHRFEDIYRQYIEPRRPFDGLAAAQLEFEQYRKTHQALLLQMQAVLSNAQRDGESRAQQLLSRIAAKVRTARTKR
jgi:hypothetical protein